MKAEGKDGKKQRQSQSCDACRLRKVKCSPLTPPQDPGSSTANPSTHDALTQDADRNPITSRPPCKQCHQLGIDCLYIYQPRKRGPPNLYLRRLSEAQKNGQSFPNEVDFETAKASSRAVAEKRKAKGKGRDGHELEHGGEGPSDEPMDGVRPALGSLHQSFESGQQSYTDNTVTGQSFVRTTLSDANTRQPAYLISNQPETKYTAGSAIPEDPFTPSQFMNLDPELHLTHTTAPITGTRPSLRAAHSSGHGQHSSSASILPEIAYRVNQEGTGAYYTSPSDDSPNFGVGPSRLPDGTTFPSLVPDKFGGIHNRRISLEPSLGGGVDRDFLLPPSANQSIAAVHGNPSTGGTEDLSNLPMHTLTSKTLGEVGAPYIQSRVTDNGPVRHHGTGPLGRSPSDEQLCDPENGFIMDKQRFTGPGLSTYQAINVNPLDAIIPRPLLLHIINLFFDYVYPLTPCLHKPTFIQDLARQREMEPGQGEWTALVLTTVMSTLVQVPRAFVPLTRREVKDLAYRCHVAGRNWSIGGYKDFTVNAVIIRYFDAVYNYVRGEIATCHTSLCEAQALATVLRLHEEETYTYLNPIEREVRRRIFFLLFQADKSESVLSGRPIRMREEECYSLRLPEELDDDYITETRYLQQPEGMTSVITGFNASIRIHCLGGRAITKHKEDKRDPPTGVRLQRRLEEVAIMLDEVTNVMKDCPPQLRLKEGLDSRVQSPAGGWDVEASAKLQAFFFDPQASREHARNAFLVQQANCYATKACVTFVLLQYQNDLLHLRAASTLSNSLHPSSGFKQIGGMPLGGLSTSKKSGKESEDYVAASKESLYYDLLSMLHTIPIQCLAVNGPALVNCVRYVASGLLDTVQLKAEDNGEEEAGVARAQGYLLEFLSLLSDIEKNYSLDDDE